MLTLLNLNKDDRFANDAQFKILDRLRNGEHMMTNVFLARLLYNGCTEDEVDCANEKGKKVEENL